MKLRHLHDPPCRYRTSSYLGVLIRAPALIDGWLEEIVDFDFKGQPELDRLRWEILEVANLHPGLDADAFHQHLGQSGFANIVGGLLSRIAAHAGFAARKGDDPDVLNLGINEALQLRRAQDRGDVEAADRAFVSDETDENWDRLKAVVERKLTDGPVGGFE